MRIRSDVRRVEGPGRLLHVQRSPEESRFYGRIEWVQLDAGDDDNDHLITPEERLSVAMARQ
jgi:hypothetical protein